ncbi:MAG: glycosyltransferase, partial [Candidatus Omnitrophica bacterium]|nr:glycosyltransferase [Candidatus Omnitrophota bacterium]
NTDIFGAGIARNYGTKHAKGNILLFLDQDCVADRELIKKHIHQHRSKDIILGYYAGYGNEQECYDLAELKAHVRGEEPIRVIQEFRDQLFRDKDNKEAWKCFVSAHFSIKKNIFCDYYFDESFTRWGCEDVDLGYRLFLKEKAIHFVRECVVYNSSKAPKRTKKKFLSLARSLVEMYAKHRTKTMKLYCFERFYHTPVQYRGLLQLVFRNDGFVLEELKTEIDIKSDCTVRIVPGRDFSKVSPTIEEIVPLIRNAHFEVDILKNLKGRALAEFRGCFHRLIKILRDHKKGINFEDIRRQSFLVGTRLLGPRNLSIDFHNRCNIRCLFCSINSPLMEK